jgi:tRNA pseudouridine38-40 synthase
METRNVRLVLRYDGTGFAGWQVQPDVPTVQGTLEAVLASILEHSVKVTGAGRTDAGVHALGQVANFETAAAIPLEGLLRAANDRMAPSIRIDEIAQTDPQFDSRKSAKRKTYRYTLYCSEKPDPLFDRYALNVPQPLNVGTMREAALCLVGRHDFSSFQAAGSSAVSPTRTLLRAELIETACETVFETVQTVRFEVCADGFLYKMVRNIVGTLLQVGVARVQPAEFGRILAAKDRNLAGPTAPPRGLCLLNVEY